jgi:hypothetical protein
VGTVDQLPSEELIMLVGRQDQRLAAQDEQITTLSRRVAELMHANDTLTAANEELSGKMARAQHLLCRNSGNSSMPPSTDNVPGRTPPPRRSCLHRPVTDSR